MAKMRLSTGIHKSETSTLGGGPAPRPASLEAAAVLPDDDTIERERLHLEAQQPILDVLVRVGRQIGRAHV